MELRYGLSSTIQHHPDLWCEAGHKNQTRIATL